MAVLGPGGVGGLLAALLARDGADVLCLAGAGTAAVLGEHGLRLSSGRYGAVDVPVRAAQRLTEPVDVCLVTVKATQLEAALERVPPETLGSALVVVRAADRHGIAVPVTRGLVEQLRGRSG